MLIYKKKEKEKNARKTPKQYIQDGTDSIF